MGRYHNCNATTAIMQTIGKAEDLATTVLLAADKDILLVPAMNVRMGA